MSLGCKKVNVSWLEIEKRQRYLKKRILQEHIKINSAIGHFQLDIQVHMYIIYTDI